MLLKWSEEPLKHRFSCLTDKFIKELHEVAEPMIDWLMWVFGKGDERLERGAQRAGNGDGHERPGGRST